MEDAKNKSNNYDDKDFNNTIDDHPMIFEGDVCNQQERNNYGNYGDNYSKNNTIDDDCMNIEG